MKVLLGEVIKSVSETKRFDKEQIIFLNTSDILENKFLTNKFSPVSILPGQAKKSIRRGDLLFSEIRPANKRFALVDFDAEEYVVSTKLMVLRCSEVILPKYLYYILTNDNQLQHLQMLAESRSGTFPQITFEQISSIEIDLPSLQDQQLIIDNIEPVDQKIELNNQMNETLEAMARAIFKEWFIDFGPVRAKAEGRRPFGMDDETATLFPDSFEESELGMIPKGWKVKTLSDTCDLLMGQSPPGDTYNENGNGMIFYQGRAEFGDRYPSPRLFCSKPSRIVKKGTVLLSVRAPVGDLNISTENQTCIGRGLAGVLHKIGGTTFTYYILQSLKDKFDVYNSEGTVFGSINKNTLSDIKIISPPDVILKRFFLITCPLDELYFFNYKESCLLVKIRDLLLPKLISGEIQLSESDHD